AKSQGAIIGYAHVGLGLTVSSMELPNYEVPPLDWDTAHECFVDLAYSAIDFLSCGECHPTFELNLWYHLLKCGFIVPMAGETDTGETFPRVGTQRSYVKLSEFPKDARAYRAWNEGLRAGRVYCGDGRSHVLEFEVNGHAVGDGPLEL